MKEKQIYIHGTEQLKNFAENLSRHLDVGDVITFIGNLGAGKTTLIKYLIEYLAKKEIEVTSPTFNLLHVYNLSNVEIWHFDLYRLKSINEIYELGIEDAFNSSISFIEWPELIDSILPKDRLEIKIDFVSNEEDKRILILNGSSKWKEIL